MKRGLTILLIIALLLAAVASGLAEPADDAEDNKTAVDKLSFGTFLSARTQRSWTLTRAEPR